MPLAANYIVLEIRFYGFTVARHAQCKGRLTQTYPQVSKKLNDFFNRQKSRTESEVLCWGGSLGGASVNTA